MKRQHVDGWFSQQFPGEVVAGFVVGGPANGNSLDASDSPASRHPADLQTHIVNRRLDDQMRVWPAGNVCAVLSEERLALASVGGMIAARPKDLLRSEPRGGFRCEWWRNSESEAPTAEYWNMLFFFPDGSWAALGAATKLLGRATKARALAEEFTTALGSDATQIDWSIPPGSSAAGHDDP
ncbi:MAG: hypothetical protein ACK4V6_16230 [Microthrixaceae bacterium]